MIVMKCEQVGDLLPEYERGQLDRGQREAVRTHLSHCTNCADEQVLVAAIQQHRAQPGVALEQRIVAAALREEPRFWSRPLLALAATLAVAVLGGSILLARITETDTTQEPVQPVAEVEPSGPGWVGVDAALVSGAASLRDLSVEELEQLLVEVGS